MKLPAFLRPLPLIASSLVVSIGLPLALSAQSIQDRIRARALARTGQSQATPAPVANAEAAQGNPDIAVGPKKPGTVRFGLILPQNGLGTAGDPASSEPVRDAEARLLTGPAFESVKLNALLPDQALQEAKLLNCDYVLGARLTQEPVPATGRFGKLLNMKNAQMVSAAAVFIPGVGSTAMMMSLLSGQLMQQGLQSATKGVKANNNITYAYKLTSVTGAVALGDSAKVISKSNGEDVLPGLLTDAAGKILLAAKPVSNTVAAAPGATAPSPETTSNAAPTLVKAYANYDFVPGEKAIFADDFTAAEDGEFPASWQLLSGQAVVNQQAGSEALVVTDGGRIRPRVANWASLGSQWTMEFDTYGVVAESFRGRPTIYFASDKAADSPRLTIDWYQADYYRYQNGDNTIDLSGSYPDDIKNANWLHKWHHVAVVYKAPQMKVYVDQYRVLYVPDIGYQPQAISIGGDFTTKTPLVIRNMRIAQGGGMNMVGQKFTEAKIVTHGINFDVDQATLRPESMGTLNQIKRLMEADAALKFEIDGHTDNSGAAPHNKELSQARAAAVKEQLVAMGIDSSRLTTKGLGDTKPLGPNATPEGKANNRRVEFVKM